MSHQSISQIIHRSLFHWLLLPSLAITVVVGVLLTLLMRSHFEESSDLAVQLYARHVSAYAHDATQGLAALSEQLGQSGPERQERLIDDFMHSSPVFSRLLLVAEDGRIQASSPAGARGHSFGLELSEQAGAGRLLLSRPLLSPDTGRLTIAMGLRDPAGRMVVGELDLDRLQSHIQGLQPTSGGMIVLTDAYGTLIVHPDLGAVSRQDNLGALDPIRQSGPLPATTLYQDGDGLRFGTSLRLPESGWVVLASAPMLAVLGPILRSSTLLLLVVAAMLALVTMRIRQVLGARVVAPLERFTGDIARVASGDYSPARGVRSYSASELEEAERSFIEMADKVRTREEELRESENRFRQVVENVREAFWIRDIRTQRILYASPAFESVFGIPLAELRDNPMAGYSQLVEQDAPSVMEGYRLLREQGRPMNLEYRIRKSGGGLVWIRSKAFPVAEGDTPPSRIVGIAEDITEAKRYQQALETLVQGTSASTGSEFFYSLTRTLAQALETPHAIVTEFLGDPPLRARSLAFWKDGEHAENFEYDLARTPSDEVRRTGFCCHEGDLLQRFPGDSFLDDLQAHSYMGVALRDSRGEVCGHLAVLTPGPLPLADAARSILSVFSARAGAELERLRNVQAMAQSLNEKEILLKEIHHRVKNNLQVISSLLSLQMLQIEDPAITEMFRESCDRIRSIALVHEELYRFKDLAHIDVSTYVATLTQRLLESHPLSGVAIVRNVDSASLPVNSAVPLGLILNELLTNAFKHAFPDGRTGAITVRFREDPDRFLLRVSDDGVGMPPDFRPEFAESLGMQLVHNLTLQLRGALEQGAGPDGVGSVFSITFPKGE